MEKKKYAEMFASFGLWTLVEDISDDGDGELQLTIDGELFVSELEKRLGKTEKYELPEYAPWKDSFNKDWYQVV